MIERILGIEQTEAYLRYYDRLFPVGKAVKEGLVKKYPEYEEKTEILYNFINGERIREKAEQPYEKKEYDARVKLLTIGRLDKQKGLDIAIKTADILKKRGVEFCWYVIGSGEEQMSLEEMIPEYDVSDCFVLLGLRKNPCPYLKDCTLYIQPSRHEGYSTTITEAKTLCKPIIAANIPSIREQIKNEKNGYLAELNENAFADKIEFLLKSEDSRRKITDELRKEILDFSDGYRKLEKLMR